MSPPSDKQLREAAHAAYGTSCSQIFCKAGRGARDVYLSRTDLQIERDETSEGTWITARIWIPDDAIREEK